MATAFDPYAISPDFASQGSDVITAWQRALAKLNFQKNQALEKYGFNTGEGDLSGTGNLTGATLQADGTYKQDGTWKDTNLSGGMTAAKDITDFVNKDNKSGFGGYRDELTAEANAMDAADNRPNRGFTGGLSNQARAAAQQAVARSQNQFTQGYNQFAGGFNVAGQQSQGDTNQSLGGILQNQAEYKSNEALWQSTIPTEYTPGISGGGSTPVMARVAATNMAKSFGYSVNQPQLRKQSGATFTGTAKPKLTPSRGGQAK